MRAKVFSVGTAFFLLIGMVCLIIWGNNAKPKPVAPPLSPATPDRTGSNPPGKVTANDELPNSTPYNSTTSKSSLSTAKTQADTPPPKQKSSGRTIVINNKVYPLRTYKTLLTPNDPFASQWWVTSTKLDEAWDTPVGDQTLLAIIDTGFALEHEEFTGRWHANPGETGPAATEQPSALNCADRGLSLNANCNLIDDNMDGTVDNETGSTTYQNPSRLNCTDQSRPLTRDCNRIDDDDNGYIDDVRGWDFVNYDNSVQAGELNPSGSGTTHGTLVAGVAAATGNNSKGIAGANWDTKILPIQAIDDDSYGNTLSVGRAILYAVDQGADVISLSLGSDLPDDYVREAIRIATAAGSVVVAASGNDGCECMVYPANYPEVVAVGALNSSNTPASFSSWGQNLDILAPGTNITSSTWNSTNPVSAYTSGVNGTSFAAPLVSGTLARLLSQQPEAVPLQLIAALTENTNRLSLPATTPGNSTLGYGTLDSAKATARMDTAQNDSLLYAFSPVSRGNHSLFGATEQIGSYSVKMCPQGTIGTTPVYDLVKNNSRLFTISPTETDKASQAGFSSSILMHACLQQPHDTMNDIRDLGLFQEFLNLPYRPL